MMSLSSNYREIARSIPSPVRLVAVSKMQPDESIREIYSFGQRIFGENRVQEFSAKRIRLPQDIQWHFIGHLQTNKVRQIVPWVSLIHSIDSLRLLSAVDEAAVKAGRVVDCLLEFHIASEEAKFGFTENEAVALLESKEYRQMANIRLAGVMGMATLTEDEQKVRGEFRSLASLFHRLKSDYFPSDETFREISMGMSGDYRLAIEEGSTLVRIGSALFGERTFH
jgi:pyridoxal phosphate enzyme (YggS family)